MPRSITAEDVRNGDLITVTKSYAYEAAATWTGIVDSISHSGRHPLEFRLRGMTLLAPARDVRIELLHRSELSFPVGTVIRAHVKGRGIVPLFKVAPAGNCEWVTTNPVHDTRYVHTEDIAAATVDVLYRPEEDC